MEQKLEQAPIYFGKDPVHCEYCNRKIHENDAIEYEWMRFCSSECYMDYMSETQART